jgi:hypothetical protein
MVNTVGKKYSEVERAYLAGLFDGDGALMACIEAHPEKKFRFRVRLFVKITQKKKDFLIKLNKELSWGDVRLNRRAYEYDIRNQKDIRSFIELILPYTRIKKTQLLLGLKILKENINSQKKLVEIACLADALSKLNVRSQGRRKNFASKIQEYFSSND